VGKVFMDTNYHSQFFEVMRESKKNKNEPAYAIERRILNTDHAEIGSMIIDKWNLPENFVEPIKFHHTPGLASDKYMTNVLHVADIISKFSAITYDASEINARLDREAMGTLKLQEENLRTVVQNLEYEMSNADLFLNS
jgi:HD-like signal output (HDOD) protein